MTSLVSAISGHFTRVLIFGTRLPVVAFVFVAATVAWPWMPVVPAPIATLQALGAEWQVAAFVLLVVLLTGLLRCVDVPLIRLYQGYPWKDSWLGGRARVPRAPHARGVARAVDRRNRGAAGAGPRL